MPDPTVTLKRGFFQRLLGKPATNEPTDSECWTYAHNCVTVQLKRLPELTEKGSGVRLEGKDCPERLLLIRGDDGEYYAFRNRCTHGGRRLDPVPGAETVQCCSVGKTTFDYEGHRLLGSGKEDLPFYPIQVQNDTIIITIA